MFYVIEKQYVGPNAEQHLGDHWYDITTEPALGNMSKEVQTEGWCGTINDWAVFAHGEFETQAEAQAEIERRLAGEGSRETDEFNEPTIVARYLVGDLEPWGAEASREWAYSGIRADITARTTDEEIDELVDEYLALGREDLRADLDDDAIRETMVERRDELAGEEEFPS